MASCWCEGVTLEVRHRPLASHDTCAPVHVEIKTSIAAAEEEETSVVDQEENVVFIECCPAKGGDAWMSY